MSESPPIIPQTPRAETSCLLRLSLLSVLVHAASLAILLIWTSETARTRPLVQVMTIDLTQTGPSPQPAIPPAGPAPAPEPRVRPEPAPVRVTAKTSPLPALPKPPSPMPAVAAPATVHGPSMAAPVRVESVAATTRPSPIIPAVPSASTLPPRVPAAKPTTEKASVRASYMSLCRDLIERHKEYPVMARKGRKEGTVVILGTLARDGALRRCTVNRSSGSGLLDNAALRAVQSVNQFPPVPQELQGDNLVFELPISFRLSVE